MKTQHTPGGHNLDIIHTGACLCCGGAKIVEADAAPFDESVVPELLEALSNLVFTAQKLWDESKSIRDSETFIVTHPIIEEAKQAIAKATNKKEEAI